LLCLQACVSSESEPGVKIRIEPTPITVAAADFALSENNLVSWYPEGIKFYTDDRLDNAAIKSSIDQSIFDEFFKYGYDLNLKSNNVDYLLVYTAALSSSLDDSTMLLTYGLLPGTEIKLGDKEVHEKGSLILLLLDNETRQPVWRAAIQGAVNFDDGNAERHERIKKAVHKMVAALMSRQ